QDGSTTNVPAATAGMSAVVPTTRTVILLVPRLRSVAPAPSRAAARAEASTGTGAPGRGGRASLAAGKAGRVESAVTAAYLAGSMAATATVRLVAVVPIRGMTPAAAAASARLEIWRCTAGVSGCEV